MSEPFEHVLAAGATGSVGRRSVEVSPLELLFDLVFVFAVSQLSHHLLTDLTWRGAAETLALLIGVFCVWSYTSFEATMLCVGRAYTRWMMLAVMSGGLFMNAAIGSAFDTRAWAFVVPLLVIQIGRPTLTSALVADPLLPGHYRRMLLWMVATAPLWVAGAFAAPGPRLVWWAVAASVDLLGTWLAHPTPGRVLRSENVAFDAEHMVERCRLFLIIALGETVLLTGTAITQAPATLATLVTGMAGLAAVVALWALFFAGSDHLVNRHLETTTDPIRAGRMTMNGLVAVVAGLIALGVGSELVITHPGAATTFTLALLLFGGPLLYLLTQAWYLRAVLRTRSSARWVGMAELVVAAVVSWAWATAGVAAVILAGLLVGLVLGVLRENGWRP